MFMLCKMQVCKIRGRTVEIIHGTMHNAMKQSVTLKKIESNPCEDAVILNKSKEEEEGLKTLLFIKPL
ncbi:hypothetical protein M3215_04230 [Bacillus cytotoxicus]|uniref:Uncharacterized protein n=1 Tax=Bacillus cytotoxicus TaxID=580165 RepID=A0ACC6A2D1_9BACI|nr:hypothetical protein [Bacillus cytotoxicus]